MSLSYKKFPGEAIIVISIDGSSFSTSDHQQEAIRRDVMNIVHMTPGMDYIILDVSNLKFTFIELVRILNEARDEFEDMGGKRFIDANMRYLLVGEDSMVDLAVNSFKQAQYGGIEMQHFHTMGEAIVHARAELAEEEEMVS